MFSRLFLLFMAFFSTASFALNETIQNKEPPRNIGLEINRCNDYVKNDYAKALNCYLQLHTRRQ